jgi:hypothetical protein
VVSGGRLRWAPVVAALALGIAGAAVALAGAGSGWWGSDGTALSPVQALTARASLSSRSVGFGDPVEARLDVVADSRLVAPAAVKVAASFAPYVARELPVQRIEAGPAVLLRHRWRLECLTEECLPKEASRTFAFPAAKVAGDVQPVTAAWPALDVLRRTTAADDARSTPAWRIDDSVPDPTWEASASTLGWLLGGGAAVLALGAGGLLALALRPGPRERARLAGVARATALVREALATGDEPDVRRALETLAAALGAGDQAALAAQAERLAWSAEPPARAAVDTLLAELAPAEARA